MAQREDTTASPPLEGDACRHCGHTGPHAEGPGTEQHYARLECGRCGRYIRWLPAPTDRRRDRNDAHRSFWSKHYGGDMVCHWCLTRESETRSVFAIDHILPLERGGADERKNTRPLCSPCHDVRHALELHSRHLRGLSARETAA